MAWVHPMNTYRRLVLVSIFVLIAAVSLWLVACTKRPVTEGMNVLLIVVDTLRADHMGVYGYERNTTPVVDQLAKEAMVFDRAHSHSPWTTPSMASLFTSMVPRDHGIVNWMQPLKTDFLTIAEQMKQNGYQTAAVVSHVIFKPKYHFNQGFDYYDYSVLKKGKSRDISTSKEVSDLAISFLENDRDGRPFFLWVHYFDPHNSYLPHEGFDFGSRKMDLYDGEVAYTDHHIGRLLDELKKRKLWDNTVIVFTADHGEEFLDHGGLYHSVTLYEELIRIPLLLRIPGLRPGRIGAVVSQMGVAPMLCRITGVPVPEAFQGMPLPVKSGWFQTRENRTIFAETFRYAQKRGVLHDGWKYIHDLEAGQEELFHLESDPKEKTNVLMEQPEKAEKLKSLLNAHYQVERETVEEEELSDTLKKELKSLGYIQ